MPDYEAYRTENGYQLIRRYRCKTGTRIDLLQRPDGSRFICRFYDHPAPAYGTIQGHSCDSLAQIYRYLENGDGSAVVEEEFVDGLSLSQLLTTYRLDTPQVCAIVREVCRALQVLHKQNLVHRDIKPENILLTSQGRVVLLDLDAASNQSGEGSRDTQLLGTVGYAAPEQFGFGRSDARTDIFSVGVLMNVLLTGQHPSQVLADGPLRPVIETCIQMNARKRFQSVDELMRKLPRTAKSAVCPVCGFRSPGGGCIYCERSARRRPRWLWAAAVAVLLLAAGFWMISQRPSPSPDLSAPPAPVERPTAQEETVPEIVVPEAPQAFQSMPLVAGVYDGEIPQGRSDITASFLYEGETYYLAPAIWFGGAIQPYTSHDFSFPAGTATPQTFCIGFWTKDSGDGWLPVDEVRRRTLAAAFQELRLTLYAAQEGQGELWSCAPEEGCPWPAALGINLDDSSVGRWLLAAECTLDGQSFSAVVPLEYHKMDVLSFSPDVDAEEAVVSQINQWLSRQAQQPDTILEVQLPAGTFQGQILVPAALDDVRIKGVQGNDGPDTVLYGGVCSDARTCELFSLRFLGCGKEQQSWPDGTPNRGFYGTGAGSYTDCSFQDFAYAVTCTERLRFGGVNTTFLRNGVGLLLDSSRNAGGKLTLYRSIFQENDVAVAFRRLSDNLPSSSFAMEDVRFLDNTVDIANGCGKDFYFPNTQFFHGGTQGAVLDPPDASIHLETEK